MVLIASHPSLSGSPVVIYRTAENAYHVGLLSLQGIVIPFPVSTFWTYESANARMLHEANKEQPYV